MVDLFKLLPKEFITKKGTVSIEEVKKNKLIGIYFAAKNDTKSIQYTPKILEFYNQSNADEKKIEIIFASNDYNKDHFTEFYDKMPWLALAFGSENYWSLCQAYRITGVPVLLVFDSEGNVIDRDGIKTILKKCELTLNEWIKPVDGGEEKKEENLFQQNVPAQ